MWRMRTLQIGIGQLGAPAMGAEDAAETRALMGVPIAAATATAVVAISV